MRYFLLFVIFACLGTSTHAAEKMIEGQVPDERPLTPDYSKLYYLGYNKETSSSPCIGNPITAECAFATYYACVEWWDQKLCKLMGHKIPIGAENYKPNKRVMQIYKFLSKRALTAEDIPDNYRDIWRVGDTVIFTASQVCKRYDHCYTALEDRSDPKGKCLPLDCVPSGHDVHDNGKYSTDVIVIRQERDGKSLVISYLTSFTLDGMPDRPERLYQEGLAQSPW